ncbi:thioredoxin-like protein [Chaetomium fimeti]|uniref:Thioredoxin-like protein n=1 Tax=Chaetomium fimeti TaxID=1854472 RepID=A0AAE0LVF6_9PEZI|nr:thioredoxin-like protein [Chaetomium fimeti]
MAAIIRQIFRRKKEPPLVCSVSLDADVHSEHRHTAACFVDFEPLAIVEFFQSQGCLSCPPAIPAILEGVNQPNLLLLSYNVTIFDHLGWPDTLASPKWDARQRAYAKLWGRNNLYTPMVVGNGVTDGPGAGGRQEITDIVARSRETNRDLGWQVYVDVNDTDLRIDSDKQEGEVGVYDILLAIYDPRLEKIKIKKGPNKGKKLDHVNVVTDLVKVGEWRGGNTTLPLPTAKSDLPPGKEAVVMLQAPAGGHILAAAKL